MWFRLCRKFASLEHPDRRLVLEAALLLALVWAGLCVLRFATLRRVLDRYVDRRPIPDGAYSRRYAFIRRNRASEMEPHRFLRACHEQGLTGLVYERLAGGGVNQWPDEIVEPLAADARALAATELLRQRELRAILARLAAEGIQPIVLKGTALAYSLYESPASRPRIDTDLLIRSDDMASARRVLFDVGYEAPIHCDGDLLFHQFPLKKTDEFGLVHTLDVHWKISTQSVFADVIGFDEIAQASEPLPALGEHARAAGSLHALLLSCIHPVMHHRNVEWLPWIYDVHLLASRLSDQGVRGVH